MRPSKLILWAVCVALLAAELASAEASPPYEEVAGDAGVQGRKEGPHHTYHSHILSQYCILSCNCILSVHADLAKTS